MFTGTGRRPAAEESPCAGRWRIRPSWSGWSCRSPCWSSPTVRWRMWSSCSCPSSAAACPARVAHRLFRVADAWDPLAALLLAARRVEGLPLGCVVLTTDAAANWYANYVLDLAVGVTPGRIGQAVITALAVALVALTPWLVPWFARSRVQRRRVESGGGEMMGRAGDGSPNGTRFRRRVPGVSLGRGRRSASGPRRRSGPCRCHGRCRALRDMMARGRSRERSGQRGRRRRCRRAAGLPRGASRIPHRHVGGGRRRARGAYLSARRCWQQFSARRVETAPGQASGPDWCEAASWASSPAPAVAHQRGGSRRRPGVPRGLAYLGVQCSREIGGSLAPRT